MTAGLAVLVRLPDGVSDIAIAREMLAFGLGPAPLSPWYTSPATARSGLLLGIATSPERNLARHCDRLHEVIRR
jgi:GntR family transcriptional regulator/MocR family aminotransferase